MSTCWKCGKTVPEGKTECEYGCGPEISDDEVRDAARRVASQTHEIDYDKIQTVDDVKEFLRALFGSKIYFPLVVPDAIKKFLKEGQ